MIALRGLSRLLIILNLNVLMTLMNVNLSFKAKKQ